MKVPVYDVDGSKAGEVSLPAVFSTPFRRDIIHKAYVNLDSHKYQPQGRHPTAGMDVVARSNDPPTGRGVSRIAKMRGGGGGRQGQAGGVASVRGGRQAHPPNVAKVTWKRLNRKENRLALCSAIAGTAIGDAVRSRGHVTGSLETFPVVMRDDIETVMTTKGLILVLESLGLYGDVQRLESRRNRTGKSALRGRGKKVGKSILFIVSDDTTLRKACGSIPGVEAKAASKISVLDMAPGADPARLTIYSEGALERLAAMDSTHLRIMEKRA